MRTHPETLAPLCGNRLARLLALCLLGLLPPACESDGVTASGRGEEKDAAMDAREVPETQEKPDTQEKIAKSLEEWKSTLTPEQYYVCREKGTEPPGTGAYVNEKRSGRYLCVACGNELFSSGAKYDSGSGWPSFWQPAQESSVATAADNSLRMRRTEVLCSHCDSHLGHVFDDGPEPTGLRYCVNSAALKFVPQAEAGED